MTERSSRRASEIEKADFQALYPDGFDGEDIRDIAALLGLSSRRASFANTMSNPEFYPMGRLPREKKT